MSCVSRASYLSVIVLGFTDFILRDTFLAQSLLLGVGDFAKRAQGTLRVATVERVSAIDLAKGDAIKVALRAQIA